MPHLGGAGRPNRKEAIMYGLFGGGEIRNLTPEDVANGLQAGEMILVDVREPNETAIERIPGAVLLPLSTFDPTELPDPDGRAIVFSCGSGVRSIKAAEIAQAAGLPHNAHLAGGLKAWKAAGLPTER
jgi:rhodanese-related sulfurtransferase